jgi:hypothetical protein
LSSPSLPPSLALLIHLLTLLLRLPLPSLRLLLCLHSQLTECEILLEDLSNLLSSSSSASSSASSTHKTSPEQIISGPSLLENFIAEDSHDHSGSGSDAESEAPLNIYRLVVRLDDTDSGSSHGNDERKADGHCECCIVMEYSFTSPNPMEISFIQSMTSVLQTFHRHVTHKQLVSHLQRQLHKVSLESEEQLVTHEQTVKEFESFDAINKCFQFIKEELIFPPALTSSPPLAAAAAAAPASHVPAPVPTSVASVAAAGSPQEAQEAWLTLWYGHEVKEKKKIQNHVKGIFHRIENLISQTPLPEVINSWIIPIDMSASLCSALSLPSLLLRSHLFSPLLSSPLISSLPSSLTSPLIHPSLLLSSRHCLTGICCKK